MKVIQIIEATESSKKEGFYKGETYQVVGTAVINERGQSVGLYVLLDTGCTVKMIEL